MIKVAEALGFAVTVLVIVIGYFVVFQLEGILSANRANRLALAQEVTKQESLRLERAKVEKTAPHAGRESDTTLTT